MAMQAKHLAVLSSISILWVSSLNIGIRELKGDKSINLLKSKKKAWTRGSKSRLSIASPVPIIISIHACVRCQFFLIHEDGREKI